jgi:hypothetical protein
MPNEMIMAQDVTLIIEYMSNTNLISQQTSDP